MAATQHPHHSSEHYATYVPHDLSYSAAFEDSLIPILLSSNNATGMRRPMKIIPSTSDEQATPGHSVREDQIDLSSLPQIREEELPLPLDDARRIFASPVSGVDLTHPHGYLEGGPGLDPEMDTFPDDFFSNQPGGPITSPEQLSAAVERELEGSVQLLRQRMRARQEAREKNERIGRELKTLVDQHEMELKIQNRMAEERRRKKEGRERRKG